MRDTEIEFQNEKEWRRYQIMRMDSLENKFDEKMSSLNNRMTSIEILGATLKIKIGMVAAAFSTISATVTSVLVSLFLNKHQ